MGPCWIRLILVGFALLWAAIRYMLYNWCVSGSRLGVHTLRCRARRPVVRESLRATVDVKACMATVLTQRVHVLPYDILGP